MIWYTAVTVSIWEGITLDQTNEDKIIETAELTAKQEVENKKLTRRQSLFKDFRDIFVVVTVFMLVYVLFFRAVVVVGNSMYDTLVSGDRLLVLNNFVYRNPQPGDVIVASKDSFHDGECIVKRVIATEGQVVDIDFESRTVYVDGEALEESYAFFRTDDRRPMMQEGMSFPLVVDEGCVFVMGDNRNDSKDSRNPEIGLIDVREILGKAIFMLFPGADDGARDFGRIGVIG